MSASHGSTAMEQPDWEDVAPLLQFEPVTHHNHLGLFLFSPTRFYGEHLRDKLAALKLIFLICLFHGEHLRALDLIYLICKNQNRKCASERGICLEEVSAVDRSGESVLPYFAGFLY